MLLRRLTPAWIKRIEVSISSSTNATNVRRQIVALEELPDVFADIPPLLAEAF
jgi:hypothetical protein